MPYIIGQQKLFPTVSSPSDIKTEEWLEASDGAATIVGSMGAQFSMTQSDMKGNIKKVRTKYETDKAKFEKFETILKDEVDNKEDKQDKSATVGGLWLKRGQEYLCEVFWEIAKEHQETKKAGKKSDSSAIKTGCTAAYERTLKEYHNMATKLIVKGGLAMSPYKETLMTNLAGGEKDKDDEVVEEIEKYEAALREFVIMVCQLYHQFGYKDKGITPQAK